MHNPLEEHWKCVNRILSYLSTTVTHGLLLQPASSMVIQAYCDADWGTDLEDRRSISGHCIFLGPNMISWGSKKHTTVARSTTEAEYKSLANIVAKILWVQSLLSELYVSSLQKPVVYCDNLSTVHMTANPVLYA